jgi:quinol monooxygenase YgiN
MRWSAAVFEALCVSENLYMAIIVAGKLTIKSGSRDEFIKKSLDAMLLARKNEACEDFSVSPDPLDLNRVNIFEKWKSRSSLDEFRNSGPESDIFSFVEAFDVDEYEVNT